MKAELRKSFSKIAAALSLSGMMVFNAQASVPHDAHDSARAPAGPTAERSLFLHNLHTGETLRAVYKRGGQYQHDTLDAINHLLRDHRRNESININPHTLDRLYAIGQAVHRNVANVRLEFQIISGYRAPATNNTLRVNGGGQAKNSQHTHGNAIDFRIPGVSTRTLRDISVCTGRGGTGYYAEDGFIHIDTARTRTWPAGWSASQINCARFK